MHKQYLEKYNYELESVQHEISKKFEEFINEDLKKIEEIIIRNYLKGKI
ncbi:hypothetical protein [Caldicellulosiruptor acetigenus]|nr:hypothetical protein [Caldicellulosiruptor acetigenus]